MKILLVTHRYPPHTGGVETHVKEIATRLSDRGHDVTVFSADDGSDVASVANEEGVHVRRFASLRPGDSFYIAPQMALAVRRFDADVVHAHNYHALPLFFAALGVTEERFVVTTHYHGASAISWRDRLLSIYQPIGSWALHQAEAIIAVSKWEYDQLTADFGVDASVIPNGIDVEGFAKAEPVQREGPYLLSVGRLEEYKGVEYVIKALSVLKEYDLVVVGSGPYREQLEQIARDAGVSDRVDFLGHVDGDRLSRLYAGAEVFLNLSAFEAYGITVGEALAVGTPCVVREEGALSEWTRYDGCVGVENLEPQYVANTVETVAGLEISIPLPTWEEVTDQVIDMYK